MIDAIKKQNPNASQKEIASRMRVIQNEIERRKNENEKLQRFLKKQEAEL